MTDLRQTEETLNWAAGDRFVLEKGKEGGKEKEQEEGMFIQTGGRAAAS